MGQGIFDVGPSELMGSNVTPQQPVSKPSSLATFAEFGAQTASTVLPKYAKAVEQEQENTSNAVIAGFSRKMSALADDSYLNGTDPGRSMMQARRLYSQAMASYPHLSQDIDKAFKSFFSGPLGNVAVKGSEEYQFENKLISQASSWISPDMDRGQQLRVAKLFAQNALWKEVNNNLKLEAEMREIDSKKALSESRFMTEQMRRQKLQGDLEIQGYKIQSIRALDAQDVNYWNTGWKPFTEKFMKDLKSGRARDDAGKVIMLQELNDQEKLIQAQIDQQGKFADNATRDAYFSKYKAGLDMLRDKINNPAELDVMKLELDRLQTRESFLLNQDDNFRRVAAMSKVFPHTDIMTLYSNTVAVDMVKGMLGGTPINPLDKEGKEGVKVAHQTFISPALKAINSGVYKTPEEKEAAKKEVIKSLGSIMLGTNAYSDSLEDRDKSTSNYAAVLDIMSDPELQKFIQENRNALPAGIVNKFQQTIEAEYTNRNYGIINAKLDGISMHTGQGGFQLATRGPQFTYNLREDVEPVLVGSTIKFVAKEGKAVKWEVLESLNKQLGSRLNRIMGIDKAFSGDSYDKIFSTRIAPQIGYGKKNAEDKKEKKDGGS